MVRFSVRWLAAPWLTALGLAALGIGAGLTARQDLVVGSKPFTESRLLAEILAQAIEAETDLEVERKTLSGTLLCVAALQGGRIDVYPEYTGTGWAEILNLPGRPAEALETYVTVARGSRELGLEWLAPLGLNNTYAIAMSRATAEERGLACLSDLVGQDDLRAGFSIEFVGRADGWTGLAPFYGLELAEVRSMEHALAYEALEAGRIDLIDAYSTDAKLAAGDLVVLEDDRGFFPPYHAAPLTSAATLEEHPQLRAILEGLAFALSSDDVRALNHRVELGGESFAAVAADFLASRGVDVRPVAERSLLAGLGGRVLEHLLLTLIAVVLATAVAIPLGIACTTRPYLERIALGVASVLQTIPSLALLAVLITLPGFGLDGTTAVVALFLYALLPILRNTTAGLEAVDPELVDAAVGLGLTPRQVLLRVQLPLAVGTLVAGVRTATVISIGVATLAAFIGAGGLGELIVEGLYLNDPGLILAGALPAAALALLAEGALGLVERGLTPRGLRPG